MKINPCKFLVRLMVPALVAVAGGMIDEARATPDTGCVEGGPYYSPETYPQISDYFGLPEPGLTNEALAIPGGISVYDGTLNASYDCQGGNPNVDWPMGFYMTWAAQFVPSMATISGGFSSSISNSILLTVHPTQTGDESVEINVTGIASLYGYSAYPTFNPLYVPISVLPRQRLTYLSFNNSFVAGENGMLPLVQNNVVLVPSPFGQGVSFDSGSSIELKYPAFQNDAFPLTQSDESTLVYSTGSPNIRRNEGTVRFWFRPDWSSGHGPSNGGVFFEMLYGGAATWNLIVTNSGSAIQLVSAGAGFSAPVNLISNQWYQIAATYSISNAALYTNGVMAGTAGTGVTTYPFVQIDSFRVGSDGGSSQVRGMMDEVETFNYSMLATNIFTNYVAASSVDADGDGIPDILEFQSGVSSGNPPGGNPNGNTKPSLNPGDTSPPVIQLIAPINAVLH